VILSDRSLREQIQAGRIVVEPFDERCIQPSSIDVKIGELFRVFRNHTAGVIDVKLDLEDLTELITIPDDGVFMLHPGEFVLGSTLERIAVPDDLVARIEGKALALTTEVPTPGGVRTMGDLRVGDRVFSDDGTPVRIKDVSEVMLSRPCREVLFSDGTSVVADADHRWLTTTKQDRRRERPPSVRTTDDIRDSLRYGSEYSHQVHLAASAQYPERELPIPPYTLGYRLGDGTATSGRITTATGSTRDTVGGRCAANTSLDSAVRALGVVEDAHVPRAYMEASPRQRRSLLQGLMDGGGHLDGSGRAEYRSTIEGLAVAVQELVASLGMTCTLGKDRATTEGVDQGPIFRVRFTPDPNVVRPTRELARREVSDRTMRARAIRDVRAVESVPVRCIEVDDPRGVFLVTRSYIPTHNSSLGRLGLIIHSTAGFIDPGFDGHVTLELTNIATLPITLYPRMKIGQVSFVQMTTPADEPYGSAGRGSKYQGQRGPTPSRYWKNFEET